MKTLYRASSKIEAFYAGGAIALSNDGTLVACAYYDEIKVNLVARGLQVTGTSGCRMPVGVQSLLMCHTGGRSCYRASQADTRWSRSFNVSIQSNALVCWLQF
jgi:hypothetical protein